MIVDTRRKRLRCALKRQTRLPRLSKATKRRRALSMARDGGQGEAISSIIKHQS